MAFIDREMLKARRRTKAAMQRTGGRESRVSTGVIECCARGGSTLASLGITYPQMADGNGTIQLRLITSSIGIAVCSSLGPNSSHPGCWRQLVRLRAFVLASSRSIHR